jgi:hypothetical protein
MSTTYSSNLGLGTPALHDKPFKPVLDANRAILDAQAALGALAVRMAEIPSTTLNVAVSGGTYRKSDGTLATYAGTASFAVTTAVTNYLYLSDSGTLTASTTGFSATGNVIRLATVVAGATTITSVADARIPWLSLGGHVHWGVGMPTIAAGSGAGASPVVTVAGSDQGGLITVTVSTTPAASATVATVTFGQAFAAAPRAVILTPAGPNSAPLSGNAQVYVDSTATSTTAFVLKVGSTALAVATTYKWYYAVIG